MDVTFTMAKVIASYKELLHFCVNLHMIVDEVESSGLLCMATNTNGSGGNNKVLTGVWG